MTSRGKFLGGHWGARQNFGGAVAPPGTPLAPTLFTKNCFPYCATALCIFCFLAESYETVNQSKSTQ